MRRSNKDTARFLSGVSLCFAGGLAVSSAPLYAQASDGQGDESASTNEIVVTAERRETSLQDTPQSITVVSGSDLDRNSISDFATFTSSVQGVTFDANTSDSPRLSMRGIVTAEDSAGTDQSVALFIDGVYFGRTALLNQDFSQVERVEVLRGPQGTLFGRNVVGGALSIVTKDPADQFEASASATIGNYDRVGVLGRVAGPIAGGLLGQLEFSHESVDGYVTNIVTGNDVLGKENSQVKAKLKFEPTNDLDIELSGAYQKNKAKGFAQSLIAYNADPDFFDIPADFDFKDQTIQKFDGRGDLDLFYGILDASYSISDALTFYSLTSYIDFKGKTLDGVFVPIPAAAGFVERNSFNDDKTFSQEFRVSYDRPGLFIQGGVYYYNNDGSRIEEWLTGGAPGSAYEAFLAPDGPTFNIISQRVETESYAAFAQANFDITDWFTVIAGVRYTDETKKTITSNQGDFPSAFLSEAPYNIEASDSWTAWTPRITGQIKAQDIGPINDLMFFATYSEGWKSGGFNPGTNSAEATTSFRPEQAKNYELGVKSTWLGGDMTMNATYFKVKYTDLQVIVLEVDSNIRTENAAATVDGLEFDWTMRPTRNLSFNFGYAYYNGRFDEGSIVGGQSVAGNKTPITPEHSLGVSANLDIPLANDDVIRTNLSYNYSTKFFIEPANDQFLGAPEAQRFTSQSNLSASISYETGPWRFTAFGRNLTDDFWISGANIFPTFWYYSVPTLLSGGNAISGTFGPPRTYGFTVGWKY